MFSTADAFHLLYSFLNFHFKEQGVSVKTNSLATEKVNMPHFYVEYKVVEDRPHFHFWKTTLQCIKVAFIGLIWRKCYTPPLLGSLSTQKFSYNSEALAICPHLTKEFFYLVIRKIMTVIVPQAVCKICFNKSCLGAVLLMSIYFAVSVVILLWWHNCNIFTR